MNKTISIKVWQLLVGIAVLILCFIFVPGRGVQVNKYQSQLVERLDSLTLANQKLDSIKNAAGKEVQVQQALVVNKQADIKRLSDSIFSLKRKNARQIKNILAFYSQHTNTVIDSIPFYYLDTAEQKIFKDSLAYYRFAKDSLIVVPKTVKIDSPYVHIDETITKTGLHINSISILDSQYVRIVENKGGFFKRDANGKFKFHVPKTTQFQTLHSNPIIHVTGQNSVLYQPNNKSRALGKLIVLGLGFLLGKLL